MFNFDSVFGKQIVYTLNRVCAPSVIQHFASSYYAFGPALFVCVYNIQINGIVINCSSLKVALFNNQVLPIQVALGIGATDSKSWCGISNYKKELYWSWGRSGIVTPAGHPTLNIDGHLVSPNKSWVTRWHCERITYFGWDWTAGISKEIRNSNTRNFLGMPYNFIHVV